MSNQINSYERKTLLLCSYQFVIIFFNFNLLHDSLSMEYHFLYKKQNTNVHTHTHKYRFAIFLFSDSCSTRIWCLFFVPFLCCICQWGLPQWSDEKTTRQSISVPKEVCEYDDRSK